MSNMKDSGIEWIGEIPEWWDVVKLKYSVNSRNIKTNDNNLSYIGLENIESETGKIIKPEGLEIQPETDNLVFYCDDVLFSKLRPYLAKVLLTTFSGKCTSELLVLKPNNDTVAKYLFYTVLSHGFIKLVNSSTYGSKMPRANWTFISNIYMPSISSDEQIAIANYLDNKCNKIDTTIEREKQHIGKLKEYKQSVITEAVTKGLDPTAPMKDSGIEWIGKVPQGWEIVRLRFLCNINTGTKDTINRVDDGLYPFYVRSPNIERINTYGFDGEAILMAGDGVGAGKVFHYVKGKFDYHQRVYNLHNIKKVAIKFLYYFLSENFWKEIEQGNAKSTVDSIRLPMILNFPVSVPNESEQTEIADYLDCKTAQIDSAISKKETLIEKLIEYKKSLIYEAVTGKVEVK